MDSLNDKISMIGGRIVESSPGKRIQHKISFYIDRPEGRPRDFFLLPSSLSISTYDPSAIKKDPDGTKNEKATRLWLRSSQPWSGYIDWDDKSGDNKDGIEYIEGYKTTYKDKIVYEWKMYNYASRYVRKFSGNGNYAADDTSKDEKIEDWAYVNHIFVDDTVRERIVTFHITTGYIEHISSQYMDYQVFPSIEMPELLGISVDTCWFRSIPFDRFLYCPNLEQLHLQNTFKYETYKFSKIPDSIYQLSKLKELKLSNMMKNTAISDVDNNGIRKLSECISLEYLDIFNCTDRYPKEYNNLKNLKYLSIYNSTNAHNDDHLTMFTKDNVTEIAPNLTQIYTIDTIINYNDTDAEYASGPEYNAITNLDKLTIFPYFKRIKAGQTLILHDWMDRCFSADHLYLQCFFAADKTSATIDLGIKVLYERAQKYGHNNVYVNGDYIGKRNPWYKLYCILYDSVNGNQRPSGTYQAPDGFVEGTEDGNPSTPMEMLYVLVYNYKWYTIVRSATNSKDYLTTTSLDDDFGYEINTLEELDTLEEISNNDNIYTGITINDKPSFVVNGDTNSFELLIPEDEYDNTDIISLDNENDAMKWLNENEEA